MSGFTIPNTPDALDQNQAEPDSLDFQVLGNQVNGVVSGMTVTPGSGQTVNVASGEVLINGSYYSYTGVAVNLTSYASSNFFDIIVARLSGSTITCYALPGTTGTNPRFPTTVNLATDVVLASVWRLNSSSPASSAITDKRVFVRSNTARVGATATGGNHGDLWVQPTSWTPTTSLESPLSVNVNGTWYKLARYDTTGNFTAGTVNATTFVGNLTGNVNGTLDGYDTSVAENASTIVVRNTDASIRASHIIANSPSYTSVLSSVLATTLTASTITSQGNSFSYFYYALIGGSSGAPDYSWSGAETTGMYLGSESGHIGFTRAGSLKLTVTNSGIYVNGTIGSSSSVRFKENITPAVINPLDLLNIDLVTYTLKESPENPPSMGIIAEELEKIESCKQFIYYDEFGNPEAVMYDRLALAYIELLKDHETRLQALENGAN
jgi:hypothetical protein